MSTDKGLTPTGRSGRRRRWMVPAGITLLVLVLVWATAVAPRLAISADGAGALTTSSSGQVGSSEPYRLLTHCNYQFIMFAGRYWRQAIPQPPQFRGSAVSLVSQPFPDIPSQSPRPGSQALGPEQARSVQAQLS